MPSIDYEAEYNNRQRVPEHVEIGERWALLSAAYRLAGDTRMNQPYGKRERQRYDIFHAAGEDAPLVVYIHGGYWQRGDRKDYSFVARELNANGITVAIPSYSLCPAVSVMEIADEIQLCLAALWKQTRKRPVVVGHSAGGHLTAEMLARDWSGFAGVPADLVQRGCAISGLFDLAPLIGTSLNQAIGLTGGTARAASPLFRPPPPKGQRLIAAVGGEESDEFLRQSRDVAANWSAVGLDARCEVIAGTNHFTVVDELIRPGSALLKGIIALAREGDGDTPAASQPAAE
ncbi:MAG: alpha/beta hydrolase [Hyphomonadaceae bacterium]|nr:alpha/beta hydrolase [Hyphomonadaceae bacterium]